jgi:farnesyl-diphosphate farnesyltransferase
MRKIDNDKLFVSEFIPKVSRTFALAIKFLPPRLRHSVFTAYLLCRVADTIEDSPDISITEKRNRLARLRNMLVDGAEGRSLRLDDIASLYESIDSNSDHDHRLLSQSRELFDILGRLPDSQRRIIYHWAGEMAGGMAEFARAPNAEGVISALKDTSEWDRYCYYVAGTVGQMLTELIVSEYKINNDAATKLNALCNSFGLGLQKVNTIKDVPLDRTRGMIFLPLDIMSYHGLTTQTLGQAQFNDQISALVNDLVGIAWRHLDDAIEYTTLVPSHLKGVRMFLTVPVFLAAGTLKAIASNPEQTMTGPPVKIGRADVARLTSAAALHSPSNTRLVKYYQKLKE